MMEWISVKTPPSKNGAYWCYPTLNRMKYCALYWDGKNFSSGSYSPPGITHYQEMRLHYPEVPDFLSR